MIKQANNSIYYHIVFYIKDMFLLSTNEWKKIYEFTEEFCLKNNITLYEVGGMQNHIHLLIALPAGLNIHVAANLFKKSSSDFVIANLKKNGNDVWKNGFGYFNVSSQHLSFISTYIKNQERHHSMEFIFPELEEISSDTLK